MADIELQERLLPKGNEDRYQYIIQFYNPFERASGKHSEHYMDQMTVEKAEKIFLAIFRQAKHLESEDEQDFLKTLRANIAHFLEGKDSVKFDDFSRFCIGEVLWLMQNKLKIETSLFKSADMDEIFCKVHATDANLLTHADLIGYKMQMRKFEDEDEDYMQWEPFAPFQNPKTGLIQSLLHDDVSNQSLFKTYNKDDEEAPAGFQLRDADRIQLAQHMIWHYIDIGEMSRRGIVLTEYPVHREKKRQYLREKMLYPKAWFKFVPLQDIRNYFGEKIALYFAWASAYILWLMFPALIGFIFFIIRYTVADCDDSDGTFCTKDWLIIIYSIMIVLGSTFFDQFWGRQEKHFALCWGTANYKREENQRAAYSGKRLKDPVTGRVKKHNQRNFFYQRIINITTLIATVGCIAILIGILVGLFTYRGMINLTNWGPGLIAGLCAVQIRLSAWGYKYLATWLTNWENHETLADWNASLTVKRFSFEFFNSYSSLFYIAFWKRGNEGCDNGVECMPELAVQLGVIVVFNLFWQATQLFGPWLIQKSKLLFERLRGKKVRQTNKELSEQKPMTPVEEQAFLAEYDDTADDFLELIMQYGYVILFSVAFPLLPLIAFFLDLLEVRVDAYKLLNLMRRTFPDGQESIGHMLKILKILSFISVFSNAGILVWSSEVVKSEDQAVNWLVFFILLNAALVLKWAIAWLIPDEPKIYLKALEWQNRVINEKLHHHIYDIDTRRKARNLYMVGPDNPITEFSNTNIPGENVLDESY